MRAIILASATVLLGVGMLSADQAQNVRARKIEWIAPASANAKGNPLADRPDAAAGGRKLFQERCSACHGDDAHGTSRGPGLTKAAVQAQSDGALFWKISSGNTRTGMPAFSFLPRAQRWQLVLHLRLQAPASGTPSD
jgi:mono/diheme cytochrome c family protein